MTNNKTQNEYERMRIFQQQRRDIAKVVVKAIDDCMNLRGTSSFTLNKNLSIVIDSNLDVEVYYKDLKIDTITYEIAKPIHEAIKKKKDEAIKELLTESAKAEIDYNYV